MCFEATERDALSTAMVSSRRRPDISGRYRGVVESCLSCQGHRVKSLNACRARVPAKFWVVDHRSSRFVPKLYIVIAGDLMADRRGPPLSFEVPNPLVIIQLVHRGI